MALIFSSILESSKMDSTKNWENFDTDDSSSFPSSRRKRELIWLQISRMAEYKRSTHIEHWYELIINEILL